MADSATWSLPFSTAVFLAALFMILVFGIRLTRIVARVAARSRLGDTVIGALLLGATTSLPEVVTSLTAAADGHADLAVSNAIGSVAGQTAFLALADMAHRRANLEHAAASAENLLLAAFLIVMLAIVSLGLAEPRASLAGVHPVSLLLLVAYVGGIRMVSRVHTQPMWLPRRTRETGEEKATGEMRPGGSPWTLWSRFIGAAAFTGLGGWLLARAAVPISVHSGLSETLVGGVLTGLAGSMPEMVTAIAAVRMGALSLAVGDILGGNTFDVIIVAMSDVAYPAGPIYAAVSTQQSFLLALTVLLTAVLLMGLLFREKHGIANIGWESMLMLVLYVAGVGFLFLTG